MSRNYRAEVINSAVVVAPAGGALIADSGQLPAGKYDIQVMISYADAAGAGKDVQVQHRDAGNAATSQTLGSTPAGCSDTFVIEDYVIATNERIRVVAGTTAGAAGSDVVAFIRCRRTT